MIGSVSCLKFCPSSIRTSLTRVVVGSTGSGRLVSEVYLKPREVLGAWTVAITARMPRVKVCRRRFHRVFEQYMLGAQEIKNTKQKQKHVPCHHFFTYGWVITRSRHNIYAETLVEGVIII